MRGMGRALSPIDETSSHASHGAGWPSMGLRPLGEQGQHDIRLAHGAEATSQASCLGAQNVRVVLRRAGDQRQRLAQPRAATRA